MGLPKNRNLKIVLAATCGVTHSSKLGLCSYEFSFILPSDKQLIKVCAFILVSLMNDAIFSDKKGPYSSVPKARI